MIPDEYLMNERHRSLLQEAAQRRLARLAGSGRHTPTLWEVCLHVLRSPLAAPQQKSLQTRARIEIVNPPVPCCASA